MKTKARTIEITFSESPDFAGPRKFTDFESTNEYLRGLARNAPGLGGGYHKTGFAIVFEDGSEFDGRIDLTSPQTPDLGAHIRKFAEFYSGGLPADQLPGHISPTEYRVAVLRSMDLRDATIKLLGGYELGDPLPSSDLTKAE
jgi:hypothetical protein